MRVSNKSSFAFRYRRRGLGGPGKNYGHIKNAGFCNPLMALEGLCGIFEDFAEGYTGGGGGGGGDAQDALDSYMPGAGGAKPGKKKDWCELNCMCCGVNPLGFFDAFLEK